MRFRNEKNLTVSQLAGIIEPNDCKCHLDKKGFYTHSLLQDYPSISQVRIKEILYFHLLSFFKDYSSKNTDTRESSIVNSLKEIFKKIFLSV